MNKMPFSFHAHFYQPMRKDPFSGLFPDEYGAGKYGNFNEKIFQECYLPNIENRNVDKMSFNLGPTLVEWMEEVHFGVLQRYVESDQRSVIENGYGNAVAQSYNHCILPLLDDFSKEIQIVWGIYDFECIYGRKPLGFWFPETAIDQVSLDLVVKYGVLYSFVAQWQVSCGYTHSPCVVAAGSKDFVLFPYSDQLTRLFISYLPRFSAKSFADYSLVSYMYGVHEKKSPINANFLAMDAEFLGHHRVGREKVLEKIFSTEEYVLPSSLLKYKDDFIRADILENTSWSCMNTLKRWKGSCFSPCMYKNDCFVIDNAWTESLWNIMQKVKDKLFDLFFDYTKLYFKEPEKLILDYILYHKRKISQQELLLRAEILLEVDVQYRNKLFVLLDAIYWGQIMFTSCGFFFDDINRIELTNNLKCLKKVFSLVRSYFDDSIEVETERYLGQIFSNKSKQLSCLDIYRNIAVL